MFRSCDDTVERLDVIVPRTWLKRAGEFISAWHDYGVHSV